MEKIEKFKLDKKKSKVINRVSITFGVITVVVFIVGIFIDKYDTPAIQGTAKLLLSLSFFGYALSNYNQGKKSDTNLYLFSAIIWLFIAIVEYFDL